MQVITPGKLLTIGAMCLGLGAGLGILAIANGYPALRRMLASNEVQVPNHEQYVDLTSIYREFPVQADVVMVGDSITWMGDWHSIFPDIDLANRGVGFDNTAGLLARIDAINAIGAQVVFLMIGTNDFLTTTDAARTIDNYGKILSELSAQRIVVQSTLFAGPRLERRNRLIAQLNDAAATLCQAMANCTYVDVNQHLAPRGVLEPEYTFDDLHLNGPAYRVWSEVIRPLMP